MESIEIKEEPLAVQTEKSDTDGILIQKSTAFNLLAQYKDSDEESEYSDSDAEENPPVQQYRQAKSSSSSSSSSESSDEELNVSEIKKKLETPASDSDSDEGEETGGAERKKKKREPLKVKGEFLLDDLPPIEDLQIQVDEKECLELGTISSIVDQLVLVEAYPHSAPLNIDSVLFVDHGKKALGKIFDVIGPVAVPIYCIRFNKHDDIETKGIAVGDKVFCAPRTEYTSYVVLSSIMGKGSDASWKNDVEPPPSLIEYSDDEQERKARKPKKKHDNNQQPSFNRPRYPYTQQQQPYNNYQQQNYNNYPQQQYPMSWHQQMQPPPSQQNNFNSFAGYDRFFQRP